MIYADKNRIDQGILQDYSFDEEYGKGEKDTNTFECKIQRYNPSLQGDNPITQDFILYVEFTEYGGVIDRIESDTKSGEVTFLGRTWHGVLNSFVIEPPAGTIYKTYSGPASSILNEMIHDAGVEDLFVVDADDAEDTGLNLLTIPQFAVRYERLYDAMIRMLETCDGKLKCYYYNGKVHIAAVPSVNYAVMEEFDQSQVPFKVGKTYNNINHMICLGQGNGEKRAVIHLFCDDTISDEDTNVGNEILPIRPYTKVENPIQDSDYILDKSQQVMTGLAERTYIYDYPNAEIILNHPLLDEEPADWKSDYYKKYYIRGKDDSSGNQTYELLKREFKDKFELLTKEPPGWHNKNGYKKYYTCNAAGTEGTSVEELQENDPACQVEYKPVGGKVGMFWDWATNYANYYEPSGPPQNGIQQYVKVSGQQKRKEDNMITQQPADWLWNWERYYLKYWNGTEWKYDKSVGTVETPVPTLQTKAPDDWKTNFGSYYTKATKTKKNTKGKVLIKKGSLIAVSTAMNEGWVQAKKNKKYPKWEPNIFYNVAIKRSAPGFPGTVYYTTTWTEAPSWQDNRYFERTIDRTPPFKLPNPNANPPFYGYWELHKNVEQIPTWAPETYHYEVEDRYRILVADALEKFKELRDTSTLDIELGLDSDYDVGDIVGSRDDITKIPVNKRILRKIIEIKKDIITVSHEVE